MKKHQTTCNAIDKALNFVFTPIIVIQKILKKNNISIINPPYQVIYHINI